MKPQYLIRFTDPTDPLLYNKYYSHDARWQGVSREQATRLSFKEARKQSDHLKQPRIKIPNVLEHDAPDTVKL